MSGFLKNGRPRIILEAMNDEGAECARLGMSVSPSQGACKADFEAKCAANQMAGVATRLYKTKSRGRPDWNLAAPHTTN